jgi:hypothetical protein
LLYRGLAAGEPSSVVLSGQVSGKSSDAVVPAKGRQYALEKCSFSRSRAGNQANNKEPVAVKLFPQTARNDIVISQNILSDFD